MNASLKSINPAKVPKRKLYTGAEMPAIGLGTFGSDSVSAEQIAGAVKGAARVGYRHFDCAAVYGNEAEIGQALQEIMQSGISRKELWITSKLWNDKHAEEDVIPSCRKTLSDLQLDYLDLYLIHWPFPNYHAPAVDVTSRDHNAKPYIHENYMKTWRQLEKLVDIGLVRNIGTSNMTIPKLERLTIFYPSASAPSAHPTARREIRRRKIRRPRETRSLSKSRIGWEFTRPLSVSNGARSGDRFPFPSQLRPGTTPAILQE
jgi:diketogulonate reductase-like aldo/keto reductase